MHRNELFRATGAQWIPDKNFIESHSHSILSSKDQLTSNQSPLITTKWSRLVKTFPFLRTIGRRAGIPRRLGVRRAEAVRLRIASRRQPRHGGHICGDFVYLALQSSDVGVHRTGDLDRGGMMARET